MIPVMNSSVEAGLNSPALICWGCFSFCSGIINSSFELRHSSFLPDSGVTEAAFATDGCAKLRNGLPLHALVRGNDKLGNAVAAFYNERLTTMIDQYHADLAAVIGVDRAGRVEYCYAVLQRQAAPRANLRLVSRRHLDAKAAWDKRRLSGSDADIALHGGVNIHARGMLRCIMRNGNILCCG